MVKAVWEVCGEWGGGDKTDSTLANWLCQTGLELRTAVSHCAGVSSCLGSVEVCIEYTNKRSIMCVSDKFLIFILC